MSWKKNVLGYLTWFLYTLMTGVLLIGTAVLFCAGKGLPVYSGYLSAALYAVFAGIVSIGIYRLAPHLMVWKGQNRRLFLALEAVLVLALFVAGVLLRVRHMGSLWPPSEYYELAEVAVNRKIPQEVHGAVYYYVHILHTLFALVGNQYVAGIWLQIVLQLAAFLGLFFVLRSLYGSVTALIPYSFGMCSPYMVRSALVLSPEILYLCIFTAAAAVVLRRRKDRLNPVAFLFLGILAAFCVYLDVAGILIFLLTLFGIFCRREISAGGGKKAASFVLCLTGAALGAMACISMDALLSGKTLLGVAKAWGLLYQPTGFAMPLTVGELYSFPESLVLSGLMVFGIFSFWFNKQEERISVYMISVCCIITAGCYGILTEEMPGYHYLYLYLTILAGLGIDNLFKGRTEASKQNMTNLEESAGRAVSEIEEDMIPENTDREATPEQHAGQERLPEDPGTGKQIKYIENPLPLPKKHVKREMDYPLSSVPENDDFDYAIEKDDDFDI